ncbi:MAG: phosphoenolpyruvate--protein phosphotransferase [Planctomycetes bacterium]|jgi:phosphotransferase system enzyme I (PtsI)|nr:phosphoenolpyruvate--protein phosphotransferase [Planctomycetota bacterium]MCL4729835.1 phosphoenolpyruvate--protein phosphotransferase [Planctomycetota bacterium]
MEIKNGIPVSPGVAIAPAYVLDSESFRIPKRFIRKDEVEVELKRFAVAREQAVAEIRDIRDSVHSVAKDEVGLIFDAHLRMLEDPMITREIPEKIKQKRYTPEYAVSRVFKKIIKPIKEIGDSYFGQRVNDFYDIQRRLLRNLLGQQAQNISKFARRVIIVAHDLTPSQTATLDKKMVAGFVTDVGGPTSHTAILANALGIPAVVGLGTISADVSGGDVVIVDGKSGRVLINPDDATRAKYEAKHESYQEREKRLADAAARAERHTRDGVNVNLYANIELDDEIEHAVRLGADGVGLFRTEFIYSKFGAHPTEEQHLEVYRRAHAALGGRVLTLRTMDFGADKYAAEVGLEKEDNPFLGCRSIRLSLREPAMLVTQARAILRCATLGPTRMMLPMIGSIEEFRAARQIIEGVKEDLKREGVPHRADVPLGMMVEVPSAAICIDAFLGESDFFSIGTNDLVQYTLAVDRNNQYVAGLFKHTNPAVLRLLQSVIGACSRAGKPVSVCGEMAAEAHFAVLLLGFGLRDFSVGPTSLPELRTLVSRVTLTEAEAFAARVMQLGHADEITRLLEAEVERLLPSAEFG